MYRYEHHDDQGRWWRAHGNEDWEFAPNGVACMGMSVSRGVGADPGSGLACLHRNMLHDSHFCLPLGVLVTHELPVICCALRAGQMQVRITQINKVRQRLLSCIERCLAHMNDSSADGLTT